MLFRFLFGVCGFCGFWLLLFGFLCVCCFPLLLACLSSFTDWCLVHRQQSREQKKRSPISATRAVGLFYSFACVFGQAHKPEQVTRKLCRPRVLQLLLAKDLLWDNHENDSTPSRYKLFAKNVSAKNGGVPCRCLPVIRSMPLHSSEILPKVRRARYCAFRFTLLMGWFCFFFGFWFVCFGLFLLLVLFVFGLPGRQPDPAHQPQ